MRGLQAPDLIAWGRPALRQNRRVGKAKRAHQDAKSLAWWARRKCAFAHPTIYRSIPDGDAGDVGALQGPANRFGLIAVEAGEASPEQLLVAFSDHRFGKRIGFGEQPAGLTARRFDALPRFVFAIQRADLNDPASMGRDGLDRTVLLNGLRLRTGG